MINRNRIRITTSAAPKDWGLELPDQQKAIDAATELNQMLVKTAQFEWPQAHTTSEVSMTTPAGGAHVVRAIADYTQGDPLDNLEEEKRVRTLLSRASTELRPAALQIATNKGVAHVAR